MKGIVITEKNFNHIYAKVKKFFNHEIVSFHTFDCGMKKRIPTHFYQLTRDFANPDWRNTPKTYKKTTCVYRYSKDEIEVEKNSSIYDGDIMISVRLNVDEAFNLRIGDEILFCGNRIVVKQEWNRGCGPVGSDFQYLYQCYQIWDEESGFKDVKVNYCYGYDSDDLYDDYDAIDKEEKWIEVKEWEEKVKS